MKTELEIFSEITLSRGGVWYMLAECKGYSMYKTQDAIKGTRETKYTTPVFQIFDKDGQRIFAGMNYKEAYNYFDTVCEYELDESEG